MTPAAYANYGAVATAQLLVYAPTLQTTDPTQAVNAQGCANQGWNTAPMNSGTTIMAYLEGLLSCSEWCNPNNALISPLLYYKFTNVSLGKNIFNSRYTYGLLLRSAQL
jgi:hypothetical protein